MFNQLKQLAEENNINYEADENEICLWRNGRIATYYKNRKQLLVEEGLSKFLFSPRVVTAVFVINWLLS